MIAASQPGSGHRVVVEEDDVAGAGRRERRRQAAREAAIGAERNEARVGKRARDRGDRAVRRAVVDDGDDRRRAPRAAAAATASRQRSVSSRPFQLTTMTSTDGVRSGLRFAA